MGTTIANVALTTNQLVLLQVYDYDFDGIPPWQLCEEGAFSCKLPLQQAHMLADISQEPYIVGMATDVDVSHMCSKFLICNRIWLVQHNYNYVKPAHPNPDVLV